MSSSGMLRCVANVVRSSPILVTLMKEALSFFETSALTRATRRNIPEDGILLHSTQTSGSFRVVHFLPGGKSFENPRYGNIYIYIYIYMVVYIYIAVYIYGSIYIYEREATCHCFRPL
jgi:hypothetical protein